MCMSSTCVCVRTYARMRRMHPSVGVGECVCVCLCVLIGGRRATATCHQGITVHMYSIIGTRARKCTCMRALAECISACVGACVDAGTGGSGSGRPLIVCHFVPFI